MFSKRLTRRRSIVAIVMSVGLGLGSGSANAGEGYCEEVDLTGCGCVDAMTVFILLSSWGEARDGFADFNGDGIVGGFDLAYVIAHMSHVFEPSDCLPIPREPAPLDVLVNDETDAETEGAGLREFAIYAPFTDPNAQPISVYGATFTLTGAKEWLQTDSYAERDSSNSWLPVPQIGSDPCACDSYVTLGSAPSFATDVSLDPDFSQADPNAPTNVGWFQLIGAPAGSFPNNNVLIARFVFPAGAVASGEFLLTWRTATEFGLGHGTFTTAPFADLTGDGVVDAADLGVLLGGWGGAGAGDLDGSGTIDAADLALLLGAWTT